MNVRESPVEVWVGSGLLQGWGTEGSSAWGLLKEVAIIFITSTMVWSQVKQQVGNRVPPINGKLD